MMTRYLQEDLEILADELAKQNFAGHTILVTGATGLIGSLCVKSIVEYNRKNERKIKVIGLARSKEKVKTVYADELKNHLLEEAEFMYQDISEKIPDTMECDYIIHTANSTTSRFFMTNPVEVIESIYTGTKRVLDYATKKKVMGVV